MHTLFQFSRRKVVLKYDKYVVASSNICRIYINYIDTHGVARCVSLLKVASKISPS